MQQHSSVRRKDKFWLQLCLPAQSIPSFFSRSSSGFASCALSPRHLFQLFYAFCAICTQSYFSSLSDFDRSSSSFSVLLVSVWCINQWRGQLSGFNLFTFLPISSQPMELAYNEKELLCKYKLSINELSHKVISINYDALRRPLTCLYANFIRSRKELEIIERQDGRRWMVGVLISLHTQNIKRRNEIRLMIYYLVVWIVRSSCECFFFLVNALQHK